MLNIDIPKKKLSEIYDSLSEDSKNEFYVQCYYVVHLINCEVSGVSSLQSTCIVIYPWSVILVNCEE